MSVLLRPPGCAHRGLHTRLLPPFCTLICCWHQHPHQSTERGQGSALTHTHTHTHMCTHQIQPAQVPAPASTPAPSSFFRQLLPPGTGVSGRSSGGSGGVQSRLQSFMPLSHTAVATDAAKVSLCLKCLTVWRRVVLRRSCAVATVLVLATLHTAVDSFDGFLRRVLEQLLRAPWWWAQWCAPAYT